LPKFCTQNWDTQPQLHPEANSLPALGSQDPPGHGWPKDTCLGDKSCPERSLWTLPSPLYPAPREGLILWISQQYKNPKECRDQPRTPTGLPHSITLPFSEAMALWILVKGCPGQAWPSRSSRRDLGQNSRGEERSKRVEDHRKVIKQSIGPSKQ
jgi:hypothetical protein